MYKTKINSLEEAYAKKGYDINAQPDYSMLPQKHRLHMLHHFHCIVIVEAMNKEYSEQNKLKEQWEPDWNNPNQRKYSPWPWIAADDARPSGFGFSNSSYDSDCAAALCGSRLMVPESWMALHLQDKFPEIFKHEILILK